MLWKCCAQYFSKFGKLSRGHRTGKGQFSFQSQRKAMPNNAQTTEQLHSSHMPAKKCSKFSKPALQQHMNHELPDVQAGFRKMKRTRGQISYIHWIIKKAKVFQKKIYIYFIDYAKDSVWITTNCGEFLKRWEYQIILPASWETCMQVKKQRFYPI